MKIQICSQYYHPDNFRINDIAADLAAASHSVRVLTGLPDYTTSMVPQEYRRFRRREETVDGVDIRRVPIIARRSGMVFRVLNYLSYVATSSLYALFTPNTDCDVIYVNETSPIFQAIPALILKVRTKKQLVLYCYDLWPECMKAWGVGEGSLSFRLVRRISGWLYRGCDTIAITSRPFRQYLIDICGVKTDRILYLPQYAEDIFTDTAGEYEENGCIDFLFAGNVGAVQNLDCVLQAAAEVITDKAFRIHIVGDGSELAALRQLAAELGLGDRVRFHGRHPLEEMPRFYRLADCFLLTLRGGDFIGMTLPGKAQGYLCAGKPILAAIGGAGREMVTEADCGEAVAAGDVAALVDKMTGMIENFDPYKEKGMNGRRFYEAHYTKEIFMAALTEILGG